MSTSYKPSPLSYGSPRSSPFRRPESPASPSPLRQSTPNPNSSSNQNYQSPARAGVNPTSTTTPSKLANSSTPKAAETNLEAELDAEMKSWTPRATTLGRREREPSPTRGARSGSFGPMLGAASPSSRGQGGARVVDNNAISKLAPAQVRELREGFQTLDRDSDGQVGREDVAEMLTQLGKAVNFVCRPSILSPAVCLPFLWDTVVCFLL